MQWRLFIVLFFFPVFAFPQSFDWWKNNVNWDGTTDWWKYLITNSKYFGPNAFSVPMINNGNIDTSIFLAATANFHFSKGDNTQNLMLYGNYTTKRNTISIDALFVPYERFQLSHAKKTERRVYYKYYYQKETVGDVIINTNIKLLEKWSKYAQMVLRVGVRMPSGGGKGGGQGAARYADVPAYWIDMGFALPFKGSEWKWINMAGLYVWQTNDDHLRQDDAFLYGSGLEYNHKEFRFQGYLSGYLGYNYNGDRPMLFRINLEQKKNRHLYLVRLQQGLHDFSYFSIETGMKFLFEK